MDFPFKWGVTVPVGAFRYRLDVVEVKIPPRIKKIGKSAFADCSNLMKVKLPLGCVEVDEMAFSQCYKLEECVFQPGIEKIDTNAFFNCSSLTTLVMPSTIHTINGQPYNRNFQVLVLSAGLKNIDPYVLSLCYNIQLFVVPPSLPPNVVEAVVTMITMEGSLIKTLPGFQMVEMVGPETPDAVIEALQGPFASYDTMGAVPRNRVVSSSLEYWYWSTKTHEHGICNLEQRRCAMMVLLVGTHLSFEFERSDDEESSPALPNELWILILGWLRRDELGHP